jgi:hypothetical protein
MLTIMLKKRIAFTLVKLGDLSIDLFTISITNKKIGQRFTLAQGGELRAQGGELRAQGGELRAQGRELRAQGGELRAQGWL